MRKALVITTFLASFASLAHAQSVQTGSIGGMQYYLLPASGGCSAQAPCSVVTYLGVQSESSGAIKNDLTNYFGGAFAQANPHTIVIAPTENGPQNSAINWGGYNTPTTDEQKQMIAVVQGVEQQMGNTVNPKDSVVTGGSLGGTGTQAALIAYGPKGQVQPGVFSAGLSFDAADYSAAGNSTQIAALCGVPLTAVHGTADTNQSIFYDQNLASAINGNAACGTSFKLTPIQGHGHGTWSDPSVGYGAGTGPGTPLGWLTSQLTAGAGSTAPTTPQVATTAPSGGAATPSGAVTPVSMAATPSDASAAPTIGSATIKPGGGSITDDQGNTWMITADGKIERNGQAVAGGGDTSELTLVGGTVWGQDNGDDPSRANAGGWFTLSGSGTGQYWQASATSPGNSTAATAPPATATSTPSAPAVTPAQNVSDYVGSCTTGVPNSPASAGGFGTLNGQIYTPDGQPFIAHGINIRWDQLNDAVNSGQLLSDFPGLNMVRLYFEGSFSDNLSSIQASINALTAKGIVVEIEDHTGISQTPYTGSQLAAEQAWYSSIASASKTNPYVWFGTFNEPGNGANLAGIAAQEVATYNTIRGAGNNNPILMEEPSGGNPGLVGANATGYDGSGPMPASDYAKMTNIIWDLHYYGWASKYSTDQATVNAALQGSASSASGIAGAQTIQSADGKVPVIIGEFGNSTTGGAIDPNGDQVINAVTQSGLGYLAWGWNPDPQGDQLTNGNGALTGYGQQIATDIKSGGSGTAPVCAVSAIPTAVTAPDLTTGSTAETAPALALASTVQTAPSLAANSLTVDQVAALAATGQ
jgi:hypothetical protein